MGGQTSAARDRNCRTRAYRDGQLVAEGFDPTRISDHLGDPDTVVWYDLCEPDAADLAVVAEEFGLSPLAVEDALTERQRPKVDHYDDHLFLSLYAMRLDDADDLRSSELAVFVSPRFLVTVRKDGHFDMDRVVRAWDAAKDLTGSGAGFLLWGLLDVIVDSHFAVAQDLDERLDSLEDLLFDDAQDTMQDVHRRSYALRKALVQMRRLVTPMREVLNTLMRREGGLVDAQMAPYYQDVYDHVLRASEWTDSLRDLVTTITETNLTVQGNRLNEIMKKLTSYAAVIAVPTAVTGYFGQNVPYPGFGTEAGFIGSIVVMLVIAGVLWLLFRAKGWL
ncbi:MAG TPA: magnesium transporter CorA family protein [Mycobacteriales bacterium]